MLTFINLGLSLKTKKALILTVLQHLSEVENPRTFTLASNPRPPEMPIQSHFKIQIFFFFFFWGGVVLGLMLAKQAFYALSPSYLTLEPQFITFKMGEEAEIRRMVAQVSPMQIVFVTLS
jgi:hypothetical protein